MSTTPQRRAIRRAYRRDRQSHPDYSTLALALAMPLMLLAVIASVYLIAVAPAGEDPHDYRGAVQRGNYACAAFGRLSHSYHNQRCD